MIGWESSMLLRKWITSPNLEGKSPSLIHSLIKVNLPFEWHIVLAAKQFELSWLKYSLRLYLPFSFFFYSEISTWFFSHVRRLVFTHKAQCKKIEAQRGKKPLISDWLIEEVCLSQWEKYSKPTREKPLTDVNLAIQLWSTILPATFIILARATFFLQRVGNILSVFIQKVQLIEARRNWENPLISTAWPLTSKTRTN